MLKVYLSDVVYVADLVTNDEIVVSVSFFRQRELLINTFYPLTSSWPHLRCDVGLEEGEYK